MDDLKRSLDALLDRDPERADAEAVEAAQRLGLSEVVLYGAGTLGRSVARRLTQSPTRALAFADDTPGKAGTDVEGLAVMTLPDALDRAGEQAPVVVTILNNALSFRQADRRLRAAGARRVLPFFVLAQAYPDLFLPHGPMTVPSRLLRSRAAIAQAFELFADERSRREFLGHLRFRLTLDFGHLPENSHGGYFPADLLPGPLPADVTFIDGGAYDGDSVEAFLRHQGDAFARIHAFEPDAANAQRMATRLATLPDHVQLRIDVHRAAVGARSGRQAFAETGGMGSALRAEGGVEVDVVRLDDVVRTSGGAAYIKLDVEGGEADALLGARGLLSDRTLLAVSVYHQPSDLWELPILIRDLCPRHRLFLRTEGEDGADVICYALPPPAR